MSLSNATVPLSQVPEAAYIIRRGVGMCDGCDKDRPAEDLYAGHDDREVWIITLCKECLGNVVPVFNHCEDVPCCEGCHDGSGCVYNFDEEDD